jgi:hypothetical protein
MSAISSVSSGASTPYLLGDRISHHWYVLPNLGNVQTMNKLMDGMIEQGFPTEVFTAVLEYSGAFSLSDHSYRKVGKLWCQNYEKWMQFPQLKNHICELKKKYMFVREQFEWCLTAEWDSFSDEKKYMKLFTKMVAELEESDARRLNVLDRIGDAFLYVEMANDIALARVYPRIVNVLPEAHGLSLPEFRKFLEDETNAKRIQSVKELQLEALDLAYLPPEVYKFTDIVELNLTYNCLERVPPMYQFTRLETLFLGLNPISVLERENLPPSLRSLYIHEPETPIALEKLPPELEVFIQGKENPIPYSHLYD